MSVPRPAVARSGATRVLLADHDAAHRAATRALLETAGYIVAETDNGITALEMCRSEPPAIVLLDMTMPDASATAFLKSKHQDARLMYIPVVALSGNDVTPSVRVVRHLRKPVASDVLLSIVRLVVGAARQPWS